MLAGLIASASASAPSQPTPAAGGRAQTGLIDCLERAGALTPVASLAAAALQPQLGGRLARTTIRGKMEQEGRIRVFAFKWRAQLFEG